MDPLTATAERRIQESIERGEFDDIPVPGDNSNRNPPFSFGSGARI